MYFDNCKNLNELKAVYKKLVMENHPDLGGDEEVMKQINIEYEKVFVVLKDRQNAQAETDKTVHETCEAPEDFRVIVEALLGIENIEVELCGSWLWISGDTYESKDKLRACGCKWSKSKKRWYWRPAEKIAYWHRGNASMSQIRHKYGSQWLGKSLDRDKLPA